METPAVAPGAPTEPKVLRLLGSGLLVTALGDSLLWGINAGVAFGCFVLGLLLVLWGHRRVAFRSGTSRVAGLLLAASLVQTAIERSLSNNLVICVLLLVLIGDASYPQLRKGWARWSEALAAFLAIPVTLGWVPRSLLNLPPPSAHRCPSVGLVIKSVLPALVLGALFALLLGQGNAVLGQGMVEGLQWVWDTLLALDLSFGRFVFWGVLLAASLGLLRRPFADAGERWWTRPLAPFAPSADAVLARWRTVAILLVLNGLFFAANTVDAIYLWERGQLPVGVSQSQFVHQGVWSLISAVLLSAVVLTGLFQQSGPVVAARTVKGLSLVWVLQNVALISSVLLRLKMYVDQYQWSEQRVYVGFFLVLVSAGFALLAWRIVAGKGLNWLLFANGCAVFVLFFIVQFLDVAGWVAGSNVAAWARDRRRTLDLDYLQELGAPAYPALVAAAQTPGRYEARMAREIIVYLRGTQPAYLKARDWRSYQARRDGMVLWLLNHQVPRREAGEPGNGEAL